MSPAWPLYPLFLYPLWEAVHVRLARYDLTFDRLPPEWDGLRLLYISDSHIRRRGRRERHLDRLLDGIETDLLLLGGDIALGVGGYEVLFGATERVKVHGGRYATWGNSEHLRRVPRPAIARCLEDHGFTVLANAHATLTRGGASIALCGVDCPNSRKADFGATFCGVADDAFRILLMHAPEGLLQLGGHRADLLLSGHTHGGQIRVPGLPALDLHTSTPVDLDRGLFDAAALAPFWPQAPPCAKLIVSAGVGTSTVPVRLFCPPEVLIVTLQGRAHHGAHGGHGEPTEHPTSRMRHLTLPVTTSRSQ